MYTNMSETRQTYLHPPGITPIEWSQSFPEQNNQLIACDLNEPSRMERIVDDPYYIGNFKKQFWWPKMRLHRAVEHSDDTAQQGLGVVATGNTIAILYRLHL